MTPKQHLTATGLAVIPLLGYGSNSEIALFCVGSILIDIDHLFFYWQKTGRWDLTGMFRYFRENIDEHLDSIPYLGVCIFHTVEFFLAVAILATLHPAVRFLLAGMVFHMLLDIWSLIRFKVPFIRAYSLLEHCYRRRQPGYPFC